jgi:hypothetical protein
VNLIAAVFGTFLAVAIALLWMYRSRKVAQRLASATSG